MSQDHKQTIETIEKRGWVVVQDVYSKELIERVRVELDQIKPIYDAQQKEAGVFEESYNAYHHSLLLSPAQLELIDPNPLHDFYEAYFEGRYILNTMGAAIVEAAKGVYTQKVHRDSRSFSKDLKLAINVVIMLDDSTKENGATHILEGSHKQDNKPSDEEFFAKSIQAEAKAGDVLLFDSNLWHASGRNHTTGKRRIITYMFARPYVKQGLDYPRALGKDFALKISPQLKQILGYNALVPPSIQDFYQPREKRFYKVDQG